MNNTQYKILIIGYGEMGRAMEYLLAQQHRIRVWQRRPTSGKKPISLEQTAADSDFILFCVPANPIAELAERILPALPPQSLSLSIAKGLDQHGQPAAAIFQHVYGNQAGYGVLYGPMISEEIRAGRPAFAHVGTSDPRHYKKIADLFHPTSLYLRYNNDIIGISWSVILKNVYAILFGAADELGLGDNMRGYLTAAALDELVAIVTELGGVKKSPYSLAGLGDLVTTATSAGSHHHELGRQLARGQRENIDGEGVHTLSMIRNYAIFDLAHYPLVNLVAQIIDRPSDISQKFSTHLGHAFRR